MRALVFEAPGSVSVHDVTESELAADSVRLRVEVCGVCGSDLTSYENGHYVRPGEIMGHEFSAQVVAVGERLRDEICPGTRVAVRPMRSCGTCAYCTSGDAHLCGRTYGPSLGYGTPGGFAEEVVIDRVGVGHDVHPMPADADPLDVMWAEPLAVALHALALGGPARRVLVTGGGAVGLAVVAAALADGREAHLVEPIEFRRRAAESLGARAFAPGEAPGPYELLIDASGSPSALSGVDDLLDPAARLVLVGLGDHEVPDPGRGRMIIGSFGYRAADFARSVDLIASRQVLLGVLVTHQYSLEEGYLALAAPPADAVKVAIRPCANR